MHARTRTCWPYPFPFPSSLFYSTLHHTVSLLFRSVPMACLGMLFHGTIVGLEGALLVMRDIRFLVASYALGGLLTIGATRAMVQAKVQLPAVWGALAVYQSYRFVMFSHRIFFSRRNQPAQPVVAPSPE